MRTVTIHASKSYHVQIGYDILASLGEQVRSLGKAESVCIVSDSHVWPLYGAVAERSLLDAGLRVCSFVFPAGEDSKTGATYLELLNTLARSSLTRSDLIVALGGGVVGDLAGFAAATYLRGIRLIQVPTTLLAAVDSSVGGKTAIDLPAGKNLAGAFFQPELVLCDLSLLSSLPREYFLDGCAEVIKYGILYDGELFSHLADRGPDFDREYVIERCIQWKRDAVAADEFDTGLRMKLNLGHTIGHAIEKSSGYQISHGQAVAVGTAMISRFAAGRGLCSRETARRIEDVLTRFSLPVQTLFPAGELAQYALSDKKRSGSKVSLVVPREIGRCDILPVSVEAVESIIKEGI